MSARARRYPDQPSIAELDGAIRASLAEMRGYIAALEAVALAASDYDKRQWAAGRVETARGSIDNSIARAITDIQTRGKVAA